MFWEQVGKSKFIWELVGLGFKKNSPPHPTHLYCRISGLIGCFMAGKPTLYIRVVSAGEVLIGQLQCTSSSSFKVGTWWHAVQTFVNLAQSQILIPELKQFIIVSMLSVYMDGPVKFNGVKLAFHSKKALNYF